MLYGGAGDRPYAHLLALGSDHIIQLGDAGLLRSDHQIGLAYGHGEVAKLSHIELNRRSPKQLLENDGPGDVADHRAVFGRSVEGVIGGDDAAKARIFSLNSLPPLAFDHEKRINEYIEWKER